MSSPAEFEDYYELLQVSPNAELDTIQRVFRLLAQRFHPDNRDTGDESMFQQLLKAYQTLSEPVQRAAYDAKHRANTQLKWQIFDKESAGDGPLEEQRKRAGILGLLYRKRQCTPNQPGMNIKELEELLGVPREHLEFSIWYLKEMGEVRPGDNGRISISAKGADCYETTMIESGAARDTSKLHLLPAAKSRV